MSPTPAQRLARDCDGDERLSGLHRRFEVIAGAQAQVDWGDEGQILLEAGIAKVYSFHMTLSYSRDPFCCFTTSQDLGTFFDCHRRAFAHFGGVPASIVYDRTKTVVRRHVAPREAVPLHPEAAAFAAALRVRHRRARRLPPDREGPGGAPGRDRARPRPGRPLASARWRSWTRRSPSGCRSAAARSTAPTAS